MKTKNKESVMNRFTKYIRESMLAKSLLPLFLMLAFPINALAYDFMVDDLCYNICSNGDSVMVTYETKGSLDNYKSLKGSLVIPKQVEYNGKYYIVTRIDSCTFAGCSGLTSVSIPNLVTEIGASAFASCTGLTSLTCPNSVTRIGSFAFVDCMDLVSVTIPNSVTEIGIGAFAGCIGLKSMTIPNSVSEIGNYTFYGCSSLTSLTIPNSVTKIGSHVFHDCTGLKSVTIPNTVTKIDDWAFAGWTGLTAMVIPNSVTEIGSSAFYGCTSLMSVTIPNSVIKIGSHVFHDCTGLKSVTIPNSVTRIDDWAFAGWTGLIAMVIPNSVTEIGNYTFYGCSSLTSLTIPNSVTKIGSSAFDGCTSLMSVTIPNSVIKIGSHVFSNCTNLVSINVEPTNTTFDSRENCNAIIETATNTLVIGCKNTQIPTTIKTIGEYAFYGCTGLTSITIPNSVTKIGSYAFDGCTSLTSIIIPNSVSEIGHSVFEGCTNLVSINVEPTNTTFDSRENCNAIIETATNTLVIGCKNTIIPTTVKAIGSYAFYGCTSLMSVTIPNSVTEIGSSAFDGCTGLTSVTIPNSVTKIDDWAFDGCTGLTSVTIPYSVTEIGDCAFIGCTGLTSVVIPNSVIEIGWKAFYGCTGLMSVTIPNSITMIGSYVFAGCTGLSSVTIPNSVTEISASAFAGCTSLTSITIPNSAIGIGARAFEGCTGLTSITIPNSVTWIDARAFEGCTSLTSITIPNSVTWIDARAFAGCTGLTSITIPNSVTEIGGFAFSGCIGLKSLTIPNSVTKIGHSIFSNCTNLVSINVEPTNTTFDSRENCNAIIETATNTLVIGCKNTQIPTTIKTIGEYAFDGCTGLTSVTIPYSVTEIGSYAFYGCSGLTTMAIPNSVTEIGICAFKGCTGLTSVTIPYSFTTELYYPFDGFTGLTSVTIPNSMTEIYNWQAMGFAEMTSVTITIPNSVTKIGSSAFRGWTGLTSVTIPNSVIEIGASAFEGCTSLTSVTIPNSVEKIDNCAFKGCINLDSIVCCIEAPKGMTTKIDAFRGVNRRTCNLIIPSGTIASYKSAAPWLYFANKIDTLSLTIDNAGTVEQEPLLLQQRFQRYFNEDQYDKAIEIGELLIAQTEIVTDSVYLLMEQLAFCYYQEKNYIKAKEYYEILDTTFVNINESNYYMIALRSLRLGDCCMATNDFNRAEEYLLNAYHNYRACDRQLEAAITLYKLHSCYIAQGKLLDAINPYLEFQSIHNDFSDLDWRIRTDFYIAHHDNLSRVLENGEDLCNQNRYDDALRLYADGTVLYQKISGEQSLEVSVMFERRGRCLLMMQQYNQALYYLNLSKDIIEMQFGVSLDETFSSLTFSEDSMRTWDIYRYFDYLPFLGYWDDLILDYGIYYASQGVFESSYPYLRYSLDYIHYNSIRFFGNNTTAVRSAYWEKYSPLFCEIYPYVVTIAVDEYINKHNNMELNYSDLFGDLYNKSALFAKGLLLTSDNEFSRIIYESGDSILISAYMELDSLRNVPGPLTDEQRAEIKEKSEELEKELIVISKDYKDFIDNLKFKWRDLQTHLDSTDIAIEFLSFPKLGSDKTFYIALTVRKDYDTPHLVFLCEESKLIAAANKAYTNKKLSKLIWGKLSKELDGVNNIYFSPSGALHQVAIESMPHWKKKGSLMNQCYNIYRLSSTRELAIDRENIQPRTAAVYGGIEYDTPIDSIGPRHMDNYPRYLASNNATRGFDADSAGYRGKHWKDLSYAQDEVDSITSILKNREIDVCKKTQTAATETSFKYLRGQKKGIIHIATHGFCWNDSVAKEQGKNAKKTLSFMGNGLDAMTRSGLLFSGANNCFADSVVIPDSIDDGVLTAYEASTLDLSDLDLLVLSACETGLGEISAEGVFGLQRGFKKAGARTIIMSLWTVNDLATRDMMTQFYKYWIECGMSKQKAFFKAQQDLKDHDEDYKYDEDKETDKKMRATRPHWAAFILLDALDNK